MPFVIRIATRASALAMCQSEWVARQLREMAGVQVQLLPMTTSGDRNLSARLDKVGGKGLFVRELEQALLGGEADLAVHSVKDMPSVLPPGLDMPVFCAREDRRDAWVSAVAFAELAPGSRVGTSSRRRAMQLQALRADLQVEPVRGNVDTRLGKLDSGSLDALVLAAAGLHRLQLGERIREYFSVEQMVPACGQGALGLEIRSDDSATLELVRALMHIPTQLEVLAERALVERLGADCHSALGVAARFADGELSLWTRVGGGVVEVRERYPAEDAESARAAGEHLAKVLLCRGAAEHLHT